MIRHANQRRAFTLIELIVAMVLIVFIAGIVVALLPSVQYNQRSARGASMLQGWLNSAKQRAVRDRAPRGLRLLNNGSGQVTDCQYLEQPSDFTGGQVMSHLKTIGPPPEFETEKLDFFGVDIDIVGNGSSADYAIQAEDYVELFGSGQVHRITAVAVPGIARPDGITPKATALISPPVAYAIGQPAASYRVIRAPRVVADETLQLPNEIIVDLSISQAGSGDVMFSPSGKLMGANDNLDFLAFWVRDVNGKNAFDIEPTLIAVWNRSGMVVAHPPATGGDPFLFIKDGRSSGK